MKKKKRKVKPEWEQLLLAHECLEDIKANSDDKWARTSARDVLKLIKRPRRPTQRTGAEP
jgi:hypothetical protein